MGNQIPGPSFLPKDWQRVLVYVFVIAAFTSVSLPLIDNVREMIGTYGIGPKAVASTTTTTTTTTIEAAGFCQSDGSNTVTTAAENGINASDQYLAVEIYLSTNGGETVFGGSSTTTQGSSLSTTSLDAPCEPRSGKIFAVVGSGLQSGVGNTTAVADYTIPTNAGQTSKAVVLDVRNSAPLTVQARDTGNLTNESLKGFTITETNANSMSSGESRQLYLDFEQNSSSAQFGGDGSDGLIWILDTVSSSAFSDNAISISIPGGELTLTEVSNCASKYPRAAGQDSANRCYTSRAITSSDPNIRVLVQIKNDLANAGTSDDPILYVEDVQYFFEDGSIIRDSHKQDGSNVGEEQVKFTFDNS